MKTATKTIGIRRAFAALLIVTMASEALPAAASTFEVLNSGSTFTITRSGEGTNAAETVRYRTVSRSALADVHFIDGVGSLNFAAGELSKSVQITERSAAQIADPVFLYYQSDGATGSSRTYRFEVVDGGGFTLASADRAISYDSSKSVSSSTYATNTVTVANDEITVKYNGFEQGYHAVPLNSYFSSTVPKEYLVATHANLRILFDLQAAEAEDGYQYIQILINQTSSCDAPNRTDVSGGDPGYAYISRYMAGFEHRHGAVDGSFKNYTFPVVSAGDNSGATLPWNDRGNNIGDLCMQRFNTNCRAADGRLVVPAEIDSLGIRFTASGDGHDDWKAKSVVARIQAVPSTPLLLNDGPAVTPSPVCKGSMVSVSLPFSEVVTVSSMPTLSTTWGNLPYVAGSGANVLTFAGPVTAAAGTPLQITGLSGAVRGLTGTAFNWSGSITVSGRSVESDSHAAPQRPRLPALHPIALPLVR